jgi:hypothetical protein
MGLRPWCPHLLAIPAINNPRTQTAVFLELGELSHTAAWVSTPTGASALAWGAAPLQAASGQRYRRGVTALGCRMRKERLRISFAAAFSAHTAAYNPRV